MEPAQINLGGGLPMPNVSFDQYSCWEDMLSVQVDMISGRRVVEERGLIWRVSVSYDYLTDSVLRAALAILRSGAPFIASVLPDSRDTPVTSRFLVESLTQPKLLAFDSSKPIWHGLAFSLREEEPHG
ncbi:hypothetical protein [Colidextribacter sp. OB.20]|uniref:hypothetical protein n=1 Tax=Colidextribacter sp. OB.20 TaxID=2304568 RepID=UPI00136BFFA2|nr:hypothetical protein [Colidextribacter sp. OB.20]